MNTISIAMLLLTTALHAVVGTPDGDEGRKLVRVVVHCKSEAMIRGSEILLSDVATIDTPDAELGARVGDIRLANRPALGFNRVFPSADIRRRLIASGLQAEQIEMSGAREVVAQPLATTLKPADITAVTDPVMRSLVAEQGGEVEFELQTRLGALRVPPGRYDLALRPRLRDGQVRASNAIIEVDVLVDEQVYKTLPLSYRLRHFTYSLTTTRVVKQDEPLNASNLRLDRVEIAPGTSMNISSFELVDGMVASRDIANNRQIRTGDLAKPALIHKNDLVTLIARRGRIQVSTKAIALEDAPLDGRLRVRNLSNKKISYAVVHASGIAVIQN
ncbi:MAG: flagellar basal body P-ring formation protein FlgA [Planctomycetes bacterium]|nr:flagellar basal body P-ring formation protein FlgA [Planctomycetota bacterium]